MFNNWLKEFNLFLSKSEDPVFSSFKSEYKTEGKGVFGKLLLPAESLYIVLIESDEASTLLESFGTQTFNFLELFSIYKWSILFSPFNNISSSGGIQSCNMSESKVYKIHFHHWIVINTSLIHFKYTYYSRKFGLKKVYKN